MTAAPVHGPSPEWPWIQGIRPRLAEDVWQRLVQSTLLLTFIDQPPSMNTAATESALGFEPCAYWYLCRSEARFGSVVFLWRTSTGEPLRVADGAVAPFDTGGIWHGHIRTNPALEEAKRKAFVASYSRPADEWVDALSTWIETNYSGAADYVAGRPPKTGLPGIVYDTSNEASAWTWEARLEKALWHRQVMIGHVFWSAGDRSRFEDWLETSDVDERVAEELIDFLSAASIETPPGELTTEEVTRHLTRIVADA
jgi:hypothetical protein